MTKEHLPEITTRPIRLSVRAMKKFVIEHELGRLPVGWLVVDCNHGVSVWRSGVMDSRRLELMADQDAEVSIVLL